MDTDMTLSSSKTSRNLAVICPTGDAPQGARTTAHCSLNTRCPLRTSHVLLLLRIHFHPIFDPSFGDTTFCEGILSY